MLLGIDEVGRGSWAGPLVVGAVVLGGAKIDGLTDSKLLVKKDRERLDKEIRKYALAVGLGWVSADEIDKNGLSWALKEAVEMAVQEITVPYDEIIIDGNVNFLKGTNKASMVSTMKKADLLVPCVSAASIVAKVARDNYMAKQSKEFPKHGFKRNVGYGTPKHQDAIKEHGVTPLHRLSYWPLRKHRLTTTKDIGDRAEDVVSRYLKNLGHVIIDRNWKTKYCEIDIISKKDDVLYFTEVKYRRNSSYGGGLAAITKAKLRQMKFAVDLYVSSKTISSDIDLRLAVASLSAQSNEVEEFLEV
jgi:ribonuclease HII